MKAHYHPHTWNEVASELFFLLGCLPFVRRAIIERLSWNEKKRLEDVTTLLDTRGRTDEFVATLVILEKRIA